MLAQLLDGIRSRSTLLLHNPHPVDLIRPKTFEVTRRHPIDQGSVLALDVVVQRAGGLIEQV